MSDGLYISAAALFFILLFGAGLIGGCVSDVGWKADAVKRGFAEYDSQTGKWRWKEQAEGE